MVIKNKRDSYLKIVVSSYEKIYELSMEFNEDKSSEKKLKREEDFLESLLKDYHYIFDDLKYTHSFYDEYFKKNTNFILKKNFGAFLKFIIDRLLKTKIIDKKVYESLIKLLSEMDFENNAINIWPY